MLRFCALVVVGGLIGAGSVALEQLTSVDPLGAPAPAVAAPGDPGEPAPPTVVFQEDFENAPDVGTPTLLTSYVSSIGGTYTADAFWSSIARCNGFVTSSTNTKLAGMCNSDGSNGDLWFNSLRKLTYGIGLINGSANPLTNSANAAFSIGGGANNGVMFETVSPIPLPTPSRFLTFSVSASALNCNLTDQPRLQFSLKEGVTQLPIGAPINPCTDPRGATVVTTPPIQGGDNRTEVRAGIFPASTSFITTSNSVGIVMRNLTGGGLGNDAAFDDIRILDVTPSLDKSFSTPDFDGVSTLTFTVTNTAELASKVGWSATDNLQPGLVVASPSNASSTCANGVVTAATGGGTIGLAGDIPAGVPFCTFTVDVTAATTPTLEAPQNYQNCPTNLSAVVGLDPPSTCATVTFVAPAALEISKTSTATVASRAGDIVNYAVTVRNSGGTPYTAADPASFTDDLSGITDDGTYNGDATSSGSAPPPTVVGDELSWSGPLGVGESVTIGYSVTLTLAGDGVLSNVATLPDGGTASTLVEIPIAPSLSIVKSATPSDPDSFDVGTEVTYSFVVTNTGNVAITDPVVADVGFTGAGTLSALVCDPVTELLPGDQLLCTATYTVEQDDVDNGGVENAATVTGDDPDGADVTATATTLAIPTAAEPGISLDKTASPGPYTAAGQVVTYSFLLTNTGNVTLDDVAVAEDAALFTGSGTVSAVSCPTNTLIPGATVTCTATYTLSQADVDEGSIENTATASATSDLAGSVESAPDSTSTTIEPAPAMTVVKTAGPGGFTEAGEIVTYSFIVGNTGNVTLSDVAVSEVEFTGTGTAPVITCPPAEIASLAPGDDVTCTATYALTQADIDSGSVINTASASATPPVGPVVTATPSVAPITFVASPSLSMDKTSDPTTVTAPGQEITYSFLITNTGNVTIDDVMVTEGSFTGSGPLSAAVCPAGAAELLPDASVTCTATYTVTQADIDGGNLVNSAAASGVPPSGSMMSSTEDIATVAVDAVASLALVKSVDPVAVIGAGTTVTYTFTVTNTGAITLSGIAIAEASFTGTGTPPVIVCPEDELAPSASLECVGTYVTTAADLTAGRVENSATATASTPQEGTVESDIASVSFDVLPVPPIPVAPLVPPGPAGLASTGTAATVTLMTVGTLAALLGALILAARRRWTAK
ncbi:hypothetical protein J2X63_003714 [Agromyces sp. 3263]|uniref:DUF7507 domain-containing protein n=1 Tax=Agromyces sp. 3263 TaxID=2817750 RepID=UPI0028654EE8|nr:hypothetical protein [Agromyces sp. 3263]MDR6908006.1 hypothetical protein [Agromyces sp. 3263]